MNRNIWITIIILIVASNFGWAQQPTNTLDSLWSTYVGALTQIAIDAQHQKEEAMVQYGKKLDATLMSLKQKGDIATYEVVATESKRFLHEKKILPHPPAPSFANAVTTYEKEVAVIDADSNRRRVDLLNKYIMALNRLIQDLMSREKIKEAKSADDVKHSAESMLAKMVATQSTSASVPPSTIAKSHSAASPQSTAKQPTKTPNSIHNVILSAERVQTKDDLVRKIETASLNITRDTIHDQTWFSHPEDVEFIYASQTVQVSMRNILKEADSCELQIFFFVEDQETREISVQTNNNEGSSVNHKEKLSLLPDSVVKKSFTSPKIRYSRQKMVVNGKQRRIGSKPCGYLVVLADVAGPFKWLGSPEVSSLIRTAEDIKMVLNEGKIKKGRF